MGAKLRKQLPRLKAILIKRYIKVKCFTKVAFIFPSTSDFNKVLILIVTGQLEISTQLLRNILPQYGRRELKPIASALESEPI